jgi:coenzyme F420 hydrogenase subunit beta
MNENVVQSTVSAGLCNGCAMCSVICPQKCIDIQETPGGLLEAKIETDGCTQCGLCSTVCGGLTLHPDAIPDSVDPFFGVALKAFLVKSSDPNLRKNGQSGGAVIAITTSLLEQNEITGVISSEMPKDGSLRPQTHLVRTKEGLLESQGSKYVPIPWAKALAELDPNTDKIAVVGIPCQFRSLFNVQKSIRKNWNDAIVLKIGLVCEGVLSFAVLEHIFLSSSIPTGQCRDYRFKSKIPNGWPGDGRAVCFDETEFFVPNKVRTKSKDAFRSLYCQLCFDKMNILSDIVCADPWGINHDKAGHTVVIARTARGLETVEKAINAGVLIAEELSWETILETQHVEQRRSFWTSATSLCRQKGEVVPNYPILPKWFAKPVDAGTRSINEMLLERGRFLHQSKNRKEVIDSVASFQIKLKELKNRIAAQEKWNPINLVKRMVKKILKLLKKFLAFSSSCV